MRVITARSSGNRAGQPPTIIHRDGAGLLLDYCDRAGPKRRAKQKGTHAGGCGPGTVPEARARRRNEMGDSPTWRGNSALKLPSDVKPTPKQISVTAGVEMVSSSIARRRRSRVRNPCG